MTAPYLLNNIYKTDFPDVEFALREPDGLLAVGGDLSVERLLSAYQKGIFPWYSQGQPILWWSPDPRMVLKPSDIKISRSLAKKIRQQDINVTFDQDFKNVIRACSEPRFEKGTVQNATWIVDDIIDAYCELHEAGYAHSIESWHNGELVGGLYGIAIGKVFFGESMFSRISDASKIAFVYLSKQLEQWDYKLIDCQVYSSHLESLGANLIPRKQFTALLQHYAINNTEHARWETNLDLTNFIITNMANKK